MSYYSDLDEVLGLDEEAHELMMEYELQQKYKTRKFNDAVAAEVKRQLSLQVSRKPVAVINNNLKPKSSVRGALKQVNCKCCNKPFSARVADLNRGWGRFCSKSCKAKIQNYAAYTAHY
ncbi:hypothetical protein [Alishewanella phage vB_AspM_Slickus01]|nr:hypothetical protein [Alishewanella phage vB_AspM_Slickus01]